MDVADQVAKSRRYLRRIHGNRLDDLTSVDNDHVRDSGYPIDHDVKQETGFG